MGERSGLLGTVPLVVSDGLLVKPSMFDSGRMGLCLFPRSTFLLADLEPRDPTRACSYCGKPGVQKSLQKCVRCLAVRYW